MCLCLSFVQEKKSFSKLVRIEFDHARTYINTKSSFFFNDEIRSLIEIGHNCHENTYFYFQF